MRRRLPRKSLSSLRSPWTTPTTWGHARRDRREKAGIIRAQTPMRWSLLDPVTVPRGPRTPKWPMSSCAPPSRRARWSAAGLSSPSSMRTAVGGQLLELRGLGGVYSGSSTLHGAHQAANASLAYRGRSLLRRRSRPSARCRRGARRIRVGDKPGPPRTGAQRPDGLPLDAAHNPRRRRTRTRRLPRSSTSSG